MTTPPPANNLEHLFKDVPFHQLYNKDVGQMNESELAALIETLRPRQRSAGEKRSVKNKAAKELKNEKPSQDSLFAGLV